MQQIIDKKHIDGVWHTTEYFYKDRRIFIKSASGKGMKCHVFHPDTNDVEFTLRYSFIEPKELLAKAKKKIDEGFVSKKFQERSQKHL